jgi:hypothetical protein
VGGLSLEEYSKGLARFSSLVEKGFPVYFLCTCALSLLIVILVAKVVMVQVIVDRKFKWNT